MPKNFTTALILFLVTGLVYIIWLLAYPSVKDLFLYKASKHVEGRFLNDKKRRSHARNK